MATESTMDEVSAGKKTKGFPLFFIFEIFKTALFCDIKQWSSRHCRHRLRYRRLIVVADLKSKSKMLVMVN
jgi:hypothetical protein